MGLMEVDSTDANNCSKPGTKENGFDNYPVSGNDSGEGFPYAPVDWPKPGDNWSWRVGRRISPSGHFIDRYLYPPNRLMESARSKYRFKSRHAVEQYLRSICPNVDLNAFFASFSWKVPSKELTQTAGDKDGCAPSGDTAKHIETISKLGTVYCRAGNPRCSSLKEEENTATKLMSCDICCSEPGFCQHCCCILCCRTISSACDGTYIRCEARVDGGYICGHFAHINCGFQAYMVGTIGGSIGLDAEYYCRRCDSRTDLVSHVMKLVQSCQTTDSRDDIEKILNVGIRLLQGSRRESAEQLLYHIKIAMAKLKKETDLEDIWRKEDISVDNGSEDKPAPSLEPNSTIPEIIETILSKWEGECNPKEVLKARDLATIPHREHAAIHFQMQGKFTGSFKLPEVLPSRANSDLEHSMPITEKHPETPPYYGLRDDGAQDDDNGEAIDKNNSKANKKRVHISDQGQDPQKKRSKKSSHSNTRSVTQGKQTPQTMLVNDDGSPNNIGQLPPSKPASATPSLPPIHASDEHDGYVTMRVPLSSGVFTDPQLVCSEMAKFRTPNDIQFIKSMGSGWIRHAIEYNVKGLAMLNEVASQLEALNAPTSSSSHLEAEMKEQLDGARKAFEDEKKLKEDAEHQLARVQKRKKGSDAKAKALGEELSVLRLQLKDAEANANTANIKAKRATAEAQAAKVKMLKAQAELEGLKKTSEERYAKYRHKLGKMKAKSESFVEALQAQTRMVCFDEFFGNNTEGWTPEERDKLALIVENFRSRQVTLNFEPLPDSKDEGDSVRGCTEEDVGHGNDGGDDGVE